MSIVAEPKPSKEVAEATDKQASAETEKKQPSKDKPISRRKRKEKPQPTLFDILSPQEKPREEQLIEWGLQYGSGMSHGKYRIYETYQSNPSEGAFIEFLKQEYGFSYGAHFVDRELTASSKGLTLSFLDGERPEDTVSVTLTWKQVALGIADLIDEEKYAKENGCAALAYALDGKDGICCIELPLCKDKDGTYTELAQNIFRAAPKTYCENTGDKQGLRVLGTTQGMDLRSFSKDGDLKFYRNAKFLVLTCEGAGYQRLCSFDTPQMKEILESKCAKRSAWQGAGKGVEGLTVMSDRETAEKAIASKHGETFKALYDGQNLYGEPFRNDMSFMRRLAFWCNGDQEKMLRIFATSKLYCPEKVPDYYENMAITATEKNKQGIPPKAAEKSKSEENFYDGNEGNKKRL